MDVGRELERLLGAGSLRALTEALRRHERLDLTGYRGPFLERRVRSRLTSLGAAPEEYGDLVAADARERRALVEALGVNVTSFFRDAPVWEFLEEVALPPLVAAREASGRDFRAASLGCAGGQEAYGLAMLLTELTRGTRVAFDVDAFDVDPDALSVAAAATYPPQALEPVSSPARSRYFETLPGGAARVVPSLRARVKVSRLDALRDPLPRRYDVVLCRNFLIYVGAEAKERLLRRVHAALPRDGLVVLGQSEVVLGEASRLFHSLSPRHRVYRRVEA